MQAREPLRPDSANAPPRRRTERDGALDRIQAARAAVAGKSLWWKRGSVGGVALAIGVGVLQGWPLLHLSAVPLALLCWWGDAALTRADSRLQTLYRTVFEGTIPPPLPGEETVVADRPTEPPHALRQALFSGPGSGLHLMMIGIAVLGNLLL